MSTLEKIALASYPREHAIAKMAAELRASKAFDGRRRFMDAARMIASKGNLRATAKEIEHEEVRQTDLQNFRYMRRNRLGQIGRVSVNSGERMLPSQYRHCLSDLLRGRLGPIYSVGRGSLTIISGVIVFCAGLGYSGTMSVYAQATEGRLVSAPVPQGRAAEWRQVAEDLVSSLPLTEGFGIRYINLSRKD